MQNDQHALFDQDSFTVAFSRDLGLARGLVLIQSPFVTIRRIDRLRVPLQSCIQRNVRVCVFVQQAIVREPGSELDRGRADSIQTAVQMLVSWGIHVTARHRIHEKLAVIDELILWEGSLNILSHNDTFERMTRWSSRSMVQEAIAMHKLDSCRTCYACTGAGIASFDDAHQRRMIGDAISKRRKLLGMSQSMLAEKCGVQQHIISKLEAGKRDVKLSTLLKLGRELRFGLRPLDWYLLPANDEQQCLSGHEFAQVSLQGHKKTEF